MSAIRDIAADHQGGRMQPIARACTITATVLALSALCAPQAAAMDVPRFYWKTLAGAEGMPLIYESLSGNTNPFDPAHVVSADAQVDASLAIAGYARFLPVLDRSAMVAVLLPMGRISSEVTAAGLTTKQSASGFGDPMLEFDINIVGPPAQKGIPDAMRYEPGFSLDLLADVAFPIGEYDNASPVNIGQNRWYGRLGMPLIYQIGAWVPGQRTTVEVVPAVWWFTDNEDFVGQTMETEPMFQFDVHVTRDLSDRLWGSLDGTWYSGGKATLAGVSGAALDNIGIGFTLGYQVNHNIGLTFGYKSTINDQDPGEMRMDTFGLSLVYGWHRVIEGSRRLQGGE